ncbi:E3 ubiquitin-protein ligase MIB2-like isoform X2 [Haliotis cracherodii]|uniref:E3 ubiquitin-protein ligase MIB2-like isoform X2 n=1 Tax=Haliotis cracherodii TaxID=6455 RepID=UPI0039E9CE94
MFFPVQLFIAARHQRITLGQLLLSCSGRKAHDSIMYEGLRVVRGPDWSSAQSDGGEGHVGTVVALEGAGRVDVIWDGGQRTTCRAGKDGKHDLRILDSGTIGIRHEGVTCEGCDTTDFYGTRWACKQCSTTNLCSMCYSTERHNTSHVFLRHDTPGDTGVEVKKRTTCLMLRSLGLYPGARVVRGEDWNWGNQDGGSGKKGTITEMHDEPKAGRTGTTVRVKWDVGPSNLYRLGYEGKVDIKYVEEAPWMYYFRDNLPVLDVVKRTDAAASTEIDVVKRTDAAASTEIDVVKRTDAVVSTEIDVVKGTDAADSTEIDVVKRTDAAASTEIDVVKRTDAAASTEIDVGCKVCIQLDKDGMRRVQADKGGWTASMAECQGEIGTVADFPCDGVATVLFENRRYRLATEALLKVYDHSPGDVVRILDDKEKVRMLQESHGGWNAKMERFLGKVGHVKKVDSDGDVVVVFGSKKWYFNPGCCVPAPGEIEEIQVYDHSPGDVVRILDDKEKVRMLQECHGGWNAKMERFLGKVGRVKKMDSNGDVVVVFGTRKWYFNPACCVPAPGQIVESLEDSDDDDWDQLPAMGGMMGDLLENFKRFVDSSGGLSSSALDTGGVTEAIDRGDLDLVKAMIQSKPQLLSQQTGLQNLTPLMKACHVGNMEIARFLLDSGASLETQGHKGITALSAAIIGKKEAITTMLIQKGADIHHRHRNGQTTLHLAVHNRHPNILKVLMQKGVDVNATDHSGDTPLHDAIHLQNDECAKILIESPNTNLQLCNRKDFNALHYACLRDHDTAVEKILERDTSFVNDLMSDNTFAALHVAANNDHVECCRLLIDKGKAEVDRKGHCGVTPLYVAVRKPGCRSVELLLQKGADPNIENDNGNRPLHGLCKGRKSSGHVSKTADVARLLLQKGTAYKARNKHGYTALDMCSNEALKSAILKYIDQNQGSLNSDVPSENQSRPQAPQKRSRSKYVTPCNKCFEKVADAAFIPCGHKVMCRACAPSFKKCPLCDAQVHAQRGANADDDDDDDSSMAQCRTQ